MPNKLAMGLFTDDDLRSLKWAYSRARKDLGIDPQCEQLARVIFQVADSGERDPEAIRRCAIMLYMSSLDCMFGAPAARLANDAAIRAELSGPSWDYTRANQLQMQHTRHAIEYSRQRIRASRKQLADSYSMLR